MLDNQLKINEEWRKKKEGATLGEKIKKQLEKVKKTELVNHIIDSFFSEREEDGVKFYVRYTDLFKYNGRLLDI